MRARILQGLNVTKGAAGDKGEANRQLNEGAGVPIPSRIFERQQRDGSLVRDQAAVIEPHQVNFASPTKSDPKFLEETRRYRNKYAEKLNSLKIKLVDGPVHHHHSASSLVSHSQLKSQTLASFVGLEE